MLWEGMMGPQLTAETWRKSSYSTGPNSMCVEIEISGDGVRIRDSKDPTGPVLRFGTDEWRAFLLGVRNGEFDV